MDKAGRVDKSPDWMKKYNKLKKARDLLPLAFPSYFIRGGEYTAPCMGGQDENLTYVCVHTGDELVVFTFKYQGRERAHTAYYIDIRVGDFIKKVKQDET